MSRFAFAVHRLRPPAFRPLGDLPALLLALTLALASAASALAQSPVEANLGLRIDQTPGGGALSLSWWGETGHVYFVEHSPDLFVWLPFPDYRAGADTVIGYGVATDAPRFFARVRRIDATLAQFEAGDYDGDGLGNAAEALAGLNPFTRDTDLDGLPDSYELAFGLSPLLADASADLDGDGVFNDEDARPNNSAVGRLSVTVQQPLPGSDL